MIKYASMAKVSTVDVDLRIAVQEAIESAKIDRAETCFQGCGPHIIIDQLQELMADVDEMIEETPW